MRARTPARSAPTAYRLPPLHPSSHPHAPPRLHEIRRPRAGHARAQPQLPAAQRGKVLVVLFQRGAADALNVVVPFGDAAYYGARPTIAVAAPSRGARAAGAGAIDLDGFFGLHPALAPLAPLWERGMLAPVHAVGS